MRRGLCYHFGFATVFCNRSKKYRFLSRSTNPGAPVHTRGPVFTDSPSGTTVAYRRSVEDTSVWGGGESLRAKAVSGGRQRAR